MRTIILIFLFIAVSAVYASFDSTFINKTLRIDYQHAGNDTLEEFYLDQVTIEPHWGGSFINLIDTFYYGKYFLKVYDLESDSLIYSRGYSTLFAEWQTTAEAKLIKRSFSETVIMPLPVKDAKIKLFSRDKKGILQEKFLYIYKTNNYFISPEKRNEYTAFDVFISGSPHKKVDIVILPEGYNQSEMGQFINDCNKFAQELFSFEPYASLKDNFNIRGILSPSLESGTDIPADSIWIKSILSASFYTFDSERYCMTYDNKTVRDLAANAPYDQIYILVNSSKYGGGAIYNYYSVSVNSNLHAAKIFVHEFGHGFAGLGDEYYTDDIAYSEFYPLDVEPWEPNLTTLVNFDRKWPQLIEKDIPFPTPAIDKYIHKTGVFEGGGYTSKGVYRPAYDCLMNTFEGKEFCPVCKENIERMILFYSE